MTKSRVLIFASLSFAAGILIASAIDVPRQWIYLLFGVSAAGFALSYTNKKIMAALAIFFILCACAGALRLQFSMAANQYQDLLGAKVSLEGYIVEDPDVRSAEQLLTFRPKGYNQNILITERLGQQFFYGDWIVAQGSLEAAKNYGDFDYQKYLERYNIYATMGYPKIIMLRSHQLNPVKDGLLQIKAAFLNRLSLFLDEPQNSLAVGILIGGHGSLPQSIVDNFSKTGVSHIIAVSGFNITIIVIALMSLASVFGRRAIFWPALLSILAFAVITGASASVLRAAIMGGLLLWASFIGRQYTIAPALFFAALLMLVVNPKILYWDAGFQLSFAATAGIIYFMPVLEQLTKSWPKLWIIKSLFLTTMSAIVATLPLIILNFGILSLSAPAVNLLVLPAVPWAMLFGFLTVLPIAGSGCAMVANWLLLYILAITGWFAALPYSSINLQISAWEFWLLVLAVLGIYAFLRFLVGRKKSRVEQTPALW